MAVTRAQAAVQADMTRIMNGTAPAELRSKGLLFRSLLTQLVLRSMTVGKRRDDASVSQFIRGFAGLYMEQLEAERQRAAEEAKEVQFRTRRVDIENISSAEAEMEAAYREPVPRLPAAVRRGGAGEGGDAGRVGARGGGGDGESVYGLAGARCGRGTSARRTWSTCTR